MGFTTNLKNVEYNHKATTSKSKVDLRPTIYTKGKIDQQFKFFNLTKYAKKDLVKVSSMNDKKTNSTGKAIISPKSSLTYIPPHCKRYIGNFDKNLRKYLDQKVINLEEKIIIISNQFSEKKWKECQEFGIFAYWNDPTLEFINLTKWLKDRCLEQVSISHFTDRIAYLQFLTEATKKEFLQLSECFFKGYVIKFLEWSLDCKEEGFNFSIPTWVTLQSVPWNLCIRKSSRNLELL